MKSNVNSKSIWVELIYRREKLIISDIYRPSNLSRKVSMLLFQEVNAAAEYRNVCIMGDFNYRNVDWINIAGDHKPDDFFDIIQDNFLKQIVSEPTRENSILDLVITWSAIWK